MGFSAAAHSEVIARISTRSAAVAVTVMVPNSLGPGELLLEYGTKEQKEHYLPRLADGRASGGLAKVERAFQRVTELAVLRRRIGDAESAAAARDRGLIDSDELRALEEMEEAVAAAIAVDDFEAGTLSPSDRELETGAARQPTLLRPAAS